jgi:glyceraldehyde-3-phosphate dehydrogenase/erythrose-4-phosphate dehydrogenase
VKEYAEGEMKGILAVTDEPLVSTDLKGTTYSSVFSAPYPGDWKYGKGGGLVR